MDDHDITRRRSYWCLCGSDVISRSTLGIATMALLLLIVILLCSSHSAGTDNGSAKHTIILSRKLLERGKVNRNCRNEDIVISQGAAPPLFNGIPTYQVEIMNECASGCDISDIHLHCEWFSSASLIKPSTFKRLHYNDCLVNDGNPLTFGATLSFQYANTYLYPLSVSSLRCS